MIMENKINIAELLEGCPRGMELYSPIFGEVYLDKIRPHLGIVVTTDKEQGEFLYDGRYGINGECMLFPSKCKTTWDGFHRPFVDGDIVAIDSAGGSQVFIFKEYIDAKSGYAYCYVMMDDDGTLDFEFDGYYVERFATKEEKQKLFKAINDNGYKWNAETKTLEKLIESKFKVGDRIKHIVGREEIATVVGVEKLHYNLDSKVGTSSFSISLQHEWELLPNKFDITTLKPFDRVLVRDDNKGTWRASLWGFLHNDVSFMYDTIRGRYNQCIPYEGNEHFLGKTEGCDEFYKTWE